MRCHGLQLILLLLVICVLWSADGRLAPGAAVAAPQGAQASSRAGVPSMGTPVLMAAGSPICPEGCADGFCITVGTSGLDGFRCQQCVENLLARRIDGLCGVPAGKYVLAGTTRALDCPAGSYCPGGVYTRDAPPARVECPPFMTTVGARATSSRGCVNLPGYRYIWTAGVPSAETCPANTYSPGMRRQRACVPCPTGYSTVGVQGARSPTACVVPQGWYLKTPGVVMPCPPGEYKEGIGTAGNCQKCPAGVTTRGEGAYSWTHCSVVLPGWYAHAMNGDAVTAAKQCPQRYYCLSGTPLSAFDPSDPSSLSPADPSIKACPSGLWTESFGATASEQCLTPPGFETVGGNTTQCPVGSYRSGWTRVGLPARCSSCGTGVLSDRSDSVLVIDPVTYATSSIAITQSADDCYILAGQGLYFTSITNSFRVRNCDDRSYGVSNRTNGLTPSPCRACPTGMVTSSNSSAFPNSAAWFTTNDGSGAQGYTSLRACVNAAGFGYNGRVSQPCDAGSYNAADTYGTCTQCGVGLTTRGVGLGVTASDCGLAAGYGWSAADSATMPCPAGTYNNNTFTANRTAVCTSCPAYTTHADLSADDVSQCNLCLPGYGGTGCLEQCGGRGENATFGTAGRPAGSTCQACSTSLTGFSFLFNNENNLFQAQPVSRAGASSGWDCLAEYGQIEDWQWSLPVTGNTGVTNTTNITDFATCVANCIAPDCQFVTYHYSTQTCFTRLAIAPVLAGAPWIALKALPSGDLATNAGSVRSSTSSSNSSTSSSGCVGCSSQQRPAGATAASSGTVTVKALSSGQYSWYQEWNALDVGTQLPAPGRESFASGKVGLQQCLAACEDAGWCAGITIQLRVDVQTSPTTCSLIRGDTTPGTFLRTVLRADVARLAPLELVGVQSG